MAGDESKILPMMTRIRIKTIDDYVINIIMYRILIL